MFAIKKVIESANQPLSVNISLAVPSTESRMAILLVVHFRKREKTNIFNYTVTLSKRKQDIIWNHRHVIFMSLLDCQLDIYGFFCSAKGKQRNIIPTMKYYHSFFADISYAHLPYITKSVQIFWLTKCYRKEKNKKNHMK